MIENKKLIQDAFMEELERNFEYLREVEQRKEYLKLQYNYNINVIKNT